MNTVILCGGKGSRLSEETKLRPKPMVQVGGKPILIHLMECYSRHGIKDFTLALGHLSTFIKSYFLDFYSLNSDFDVDLSSGAVDYTNTHKLNWKISLNDTGPESMTGGRLFRLRDKLSREDTFMVTYGDGLSNVNINDLLDFHKSHGKLATVTAVRPTARFGEMNIEDGKVITFAEKPQASVGWINGGFFVFNKKVLDYIDGDSTVLEKEPLENLTKDGELMSFRHDGFWQCMDTLRDKNYLDNLATQNPPPWLKS